MPRISRDPVEPGSEADVVIIGAGAAGLIAALRAAEAGASVLVLERDALPQGSTARSAGLIPAAGTRWQAQSGIVDSPQKFAQDILHKAHHEPDEARVAAVTQLLPQALEWLAEKHGLAFSVITNFSYPGHSARRMHGLPSRSGAELMDRLRHAAEMAGIDIVTQARATTLFITNDDRITAVGIERPDGSQDNIGCNAVILACNGYGGNRALVDHEIPEMAGALYFGHPGNQGDAVLWGRALGAKIADLSGYQGHGSVAHPHGILLSWATMTEGGFQVNMAGERFSNEAQGYSEQAAAVLAQPDAMAYSIFDGRIADITRQFEDFRQIESAGAVKTADNAAQLARLLHLPPDVFTATFTTVQQAIKSPSASVDQFGRNWQNILPLQPPYCAVRVTGALFHTQGGLVVDDHARVLKNHGTPFVNLWAAGGAAVGISGRQASGYLSGNGLATAVAYGFIGGQSAAC
ncbi:MAG: FAD-dependent oxidoreductase, partial [Beijerinckiaceae bacterium]